MYSAPAEPCFFLTKRGFINAILCGIATTVLCRSGSERSEENAALILGSLLVAASFVKWY